jgi:type IX secretion system PorP/SprF family membrane protein
MIRRLFIIGIYSIIPMLATAQDPVFSQFYHSPIYLNPAFTGCAKNDFRANLTSRVQWMNLPTPMQFHSLSIDKYFADPNISSGLLVNRFDEGYVRTTQLYMTLAKNFGSDGYDDRGWFFNFAMQFGFNWKGVDRSKLLFADQVDQNGLNGQQSQVELFDYNNRAHFDVSSGFLITNKNFMLGVAAQHLTTPHNGLIGSTGESNLPRRYTFHLSYIKEVNTNSEGIVIIKPTIILNAQDISRSLVVGSLIDLPERRIEFAIWYRNNWNFSNNHSLTVGINIKLGKQKNYYNGEGDGRYRAGLSYDAELNKPGVRHTSGSTELGLLYESATETCPKPSGTNSVRFPWEFH